MARNKGIFDFSNNFEVRARAPLDAKMLVETVADLVDPTQWSPNSSPSEEWTYVGMIVSVYDDPAPSNNGIYRLKDTDYTIPGNWEKLESGGGVSIAYIDGSLNNIRATYVADASLGTSFTWTNGILDASGSGGGSVSQTYVDGSLATKVNKTDVSIGGTNWAIDVSGTLLRFRYNGKDKVIFTPDGSIMVSGHLTFNNNW
jgi:hypothetical protein